jgi:hypothetical protein
MDMGSSQEVQIILDEVSYGMAGFNINLPSALVDSSLQAF